LWLAGQHRLPATSPLLIQPPCINFQGAISLAGMIDLEQIWQHSLGKGAKEAVANFLGGSPGNCPERYAQASPAALLPLELPQVLIHGTDDLSVSLIVSQHYAQKARAAGDDVKLVTLSDVEHFAIIHPQTDAGTRVLHEIVQMTQLSPAP
jgi:pimeloyl-ACP methyl ester carboxylesterase